MFSQPFRYRYPQKYPHLQNPLLPVCRGRDKRHQSACSHLSSDSSGRQRLHFSTLAIAAFRCFKDTPREQRRAVTLSGAQYQALYSNRDEAMTCAYLSTAFPCLTSPPLFMSRVEQSVGPYLHLVNATCHRSRQPGLRSCTNGGLDPGPRARGVAGRKVRRNQFPIISMTRGDEITAPFSEPKILTPKFILLGSEL